MNTNTILLLLFFSLLVFFFIYVFPRLLPLLTKQKATRQEALMLGLAIEDVEREVPIFFSRGQPIKLVRHQCVKYTLRKTRTDTPDWDFLQRIKAKDVEYPHNWQPIKGVREPEVWMLVVKNGDIPAELKRVLTEIAGVWTEEYLEFEGSQAQISAYWEEGGGPQQARIIYTYLQLLAKADTRAA
jgi:hypothetical protein